MTESINHNYRCIKLPLKNIINNTSYLQSINDVIFKANIITNKAYMLLRYWILNIYHSNPTLDFPIIDRNIIKMAFKSIVKETRGPKLKGNNLLLKQNFDQITMQIFNIKSLINNDKNTIKLDKLDNLDKLNLKLNNENLEDGINLSAILDYYSITMLTAIENNIKIHFFDHMYRFINNYFKYLFKENIDKNLINKNDLMKELKKVKYDLLNNTLTSDQKYHEWINKNRTNILPNIEHTDSVRSKNYQKYQKYQKYQYDIKENPQKYLKYMIFMNIELEKIGQKMFQFFPLQTNNIPKHIQIDTKGLIEIFETKASKLFNNIESHKTNIWTKYFPLLLNSKKFKIKKYTFDHCIITDGYSVSIRYIKNTYMDINNQKKQKMKQGKIDSKLKLNQDELLLLNKQKKEKNELMKNDSEQLSIKKQTSKQKKLDEFPYIDDVPIEDLKRYTKHIFIDPGKRSLFTMLDDDGTFFSYTNKCRLSETKRLKYQKILKNHRDKSGITKIEVDNKLSDYNCKTCNLDKFKQYIKIKLEINDKLNENNIKYEDLYKDIKFRKYKLYGYINTKKSEDNMINMIDKKFKINKKIINMIDNELIKKEQLSEQSLYENNKIIRKKRKQEIKKTNNKDKYKHYTNREDCVIIIGDWSTGKQMANFISTPNIGLKRKLKENYKVYNIDEFRTSCLHNKTEELCKNLYLKRSNNININNKDIKEKNKIRKMHSILTYKMENKDRKSTRLNSSH